MSLCLGLQLTSRAGSNLKHLPSLEAEHEVATLQVLQHTSTNSTFVRYSLGCQKVSNIFPLSTVFL